MGDSRLAAPQKILSVTDGVAIMVGVVIGIGVFKTPSLVASNVGSEAAFLGVWALGGLATLIGVLCYAELAAAEPDSGGEYHFLSRAFGVRLALLFGWARGTIIQTGAIAAVAFVLGDYAAQIAPLGAWGPLIYAVLSICAITAFNLLGTPLGKSLQNALTLLTIIAVLAIALAPLLIETPPRVPLAPDASSGSLGLAMILVLLTYGGWNEAAYISAEMRDVKRDAPRMLIAGTIILTTIYVAVNAALLWTLGLAGLRDASAPGADILRLATGDAGAILISLIVVITAASTLNGTIFTGARIYYAVGRDLPLLRRLGVWDSFRDNPRNGILLQSAIALVLVVLGGVTRDGFQAMVDYTAPVFWSFMFLVGLSLFVLRRREPDRILPFRVPLYPLTPALFCAICLYMLHASIAYTGYGAFAGLAVLALGAPLLFSRTAGARQTSPVEHPETTS